MSYKYKVRSCTIYQFFNKIHDMRSSSAFFLLFSLLSFAYLIDARRSPGDYWKSVMNNESMPEAITDLLRQDVTSEPDETKFSMASNRYIRNFDVRPNVILYHSDADSEKMKISADGVKMVHGDDKRVKLKPVVSNFDSS